MLLSVTFSNNHENEIMKIVVLDFVAFKGQSPFQCRAVDVTRVSVSCPARPSLPDLYEQFVNEPVWLQQLCETL